MIDRRTQHSGLFSVTLIGYTNASKSSMMHAITSSNVEGENKLFATQGTTIRYIPLHSLASDTVDFIKRLPHYLVASFHSTLAEAYDASLLLYVVNASDPSFRSQLEIVLAEVGVEGSKKLLVLNKSTQYKY